MGRMLLITIIIAEEELESRTELNKDFCLIDNKFCFIRGNIEIPIIDVDEEFIWTVWVSLSEENFLRSNFRLLSGQSSMCFKKAFQ
jgi:hypothetical protein